VAINGYPALVDEQESVALRLFDTADKAQRSMKAGLGRLFMLELSKELKYLRKNLPDINQLCMHYTSIGPCDELIDDLLQAITNQVFIEDKPIIRTEGEFIKRKQEGSLELISRGNHLCCIVSEVLKKASQLRARLMDDHPASWDDSINDIREHLDRLVYRGFLRQTPVKWLQCLPRYLDGIEKRFVKLQYSQRKDEGKMQALRPLQERFIKLAEKNAVSDNRTPELESYRWMLEEYRVSLFAQELKTLFPVSSKRIEKQWQLIQKET
jgi:ATP-dependent helicase HrpA